MTGDDSVNTDKQDSDRPIKEFGKKLSRSGSGSGVSLHFDADIAERYGLDDDTEVSVKVCENGGDVYFRIGSIPAGFTAEEFRRFADKHDWNDLDAMEFDDGEWYLTYEDHSGLVNIDIDFTSRVDGAAVNNVIVTGKRITLHEDSLESYQALCLAAVQKDLDIRVEDDRGLWPQLKSSVNHDTDDAPEKETLQQLLTKCERVSIQLISRHASIHTTLDELADVVRKIRDVMKDFDGDPESLNSDSPDGKPDDGTTQTSLAESVTGDMRYPIEMESPSKHSSEESVLNGPNS